MDVDLAGEPLVGFRCWKIIGNELHPVWQSQATWVTPGNVTARCYFLPGGYMFGVGPRLEQAVPETHPAPLGACSCGIYAYYSPDPPKDREGDCWGAIVAWGHIIECEHGFKAQHARLIALLDEPDGLPVSIANVAERYDIPVLPLTELEQYALMFGEVRTDGPT